MGPLRRGPCSPVIHVTHLSLDFQEDPLEEETAPTPVFLPREFHGQRSLAGYSPQGHKESDMTERLTVLISIKQIKEKEQDTKVFYTHTHTHTRPENEDVNDLKGMCPNISLQLPSLDALSSH